MVGEEKRQEEKGNCRARRNGGERRLQPIRALWIAVLPLLAASACAPASTSVQAAATPASNMAGVMVVVEGVDIWLDRLPTRTFSTVARNITPAVEAAVGQGEPVFPAQRMAAIAAAVRAQGGNAALVRTTEVPNAAGAGLFQSYRYQIDVIRYQ